MILTYGFNINMSYNKMYFMKHTENGKVLTPDARNMRARIMEATVNQMDQDKDYEKGDILTVNICFYDNWYYQNTKPKREDLDNRLKFLIDSIFKALDMDDSYIFRLTAEKIQSQQDPKCIVVIRSENDKEQT